MCFVLLYRLLGSTRSSGAFRAAFFLLLALMVANALWGWLFFRRKDLWASFLAFIPYSLIAVALAAVLMFIDRTAALLLTPYLLYLVYALWWSYRLWSLNRRFSPSGLTRA